MQPLFCGSDQHKGNTKKLSGSSISLKKKVFIFFKCKPHHWYHSLSSRHCYRHSDHTQVFDILVYSKAKPIAIVLWIGCSAQYSDIIRDRTNIYKKVLINSRWGEGSLFNCPLFWNLPTTIGWQFKHVFQHSFNNILCPQAQF